MLAVQAASILLAPESNANTNPTVTLTLYLTLNPNPNLTTNTNLTVTLNKLQRDHVNNITMQFWTSPGCPMQASQCQAALTISVPAHLHIATSET